MAYADYEYYSNIYRGQMAERDFLRHSRAASAYLQQVTFGRVDRELTEDLQERVKDACCAVADAMLLNEQGGGVASETNGKWSVTYANSSNAKSAAARLYEAAALYLGGTGLLYRGCRRC